MHVRIQAIEKGDKSSTANQESQRAKSYLMAAELSYIIKEIKALYILYFILALIMTFEKSKTSSKN